MSTASCLPGVLAKRIRSQHLGKDRHQNEEQDDDSAERPQRLLPDQPGKEIRKPTPSLGFTDGGGRLCGVAHDPDFSIGRAG